MKAFIAATLAVAVSALPTTPDYSNVDVSGVDFSKIDYSNVDYSKVDFSKIKYPDGTGGSSVAPTTNKAPFFTSTYFCKATPDQVVNGTTPTGGLKGATGTYWFGIRSDANVICYDITLEGFSAQEYFSPAATSTHIHQSGRGLSGPPRIAFPNPQGDGVRKSVGCMTGPFTTGLLANGQDTGTGFHVSQIEADPAAFACDVHTSSARPGAVRGQLA